MSLKLRATVLIAIIITTAAIFYLKTRPTPANKIKKSLSEEEEENNNLSEHDNTLKQPLKQNEEREGENLLPFTFDDLYDSDFSYSMFYPEWISSSEYLFRDIEGIKKQNLDKNDTVVIVSSEFYKITNGSSWEISEDELFLLVRIQGIKQWRHSYNGSYAVYSIKNEQKILEFSEPDVQYITWSPKGHQMAWVRENDLYFLDDVTNYESGTIRLTCNGEKNKIFNAIPDWVYEEEMVSSTNNLFWSPDSRFLAYLVTNDTSVETIEFTKYGDTQYPEMVKVAYPKAGTVNPTVALNVYAIGSDITVSISAPVDQIGEDHLFSQFFWYPNSMSFLVNWMNRISNLAVPQLCQLNSDMTTWDCSVVTAGIETSNTGWIGNGGTPFRPIMLDNGNQSFFTVFSNSEGFWQIALVEPEEGKKTFLTTGTSVVTSLQGYDAMNKQLYFIAAHPLPRNRQLFRINIKNIKSPIVQDDWECLTCNLDADRCQWISPSFSPSLSYLVINCGGPDVPKSLIQKMDIAGNYGPPKLVYDNEILMNNKAGIKWPVKEYGQIYGENGVTILYQLHKPMDFDKNKKYPLLIEVYGGPGFQKVQDRWTRGWAQIHMVSQYDILVVSLDARGSGYRGDKIAHLLYKRLGQLEKQDTIEVGRYFAAQPWVDETRLAVWGWSYGGYTTTFTISEGSDVFKCGLAVAPLATRYLYDSIHTERYMTLPEDNKDGYNKCSILNSNLENFKKASYSIIHGTADDNVHFQNAARISKALIAADVDFDNFYYADEAHSINTGSNANKHVYKLLTKKIRQCFNLSAPTSMAAFFSNAKGSLIQQMLLLKKK